MGSAENALATIPAIEEKTMRFTDDDATTTARSLLSDINLHLIFAVTPMAVLGVASITPAFPAVIRQFQISGHSVGWSCPGSARAR